MSDVGHLRAIIEAQSALASASIGSGEAVMELAAQHAQALTGAAGAVIELAEGDEMAYRAATGVAAEHLGMRLSLHDSLSGRCVRTGEVLHCTDSETDERVNKAATRAIGVRSMVVAPLLHESGVIGVLKVLHREPNGFDERAVETLQLLATAVGAAIKGTRERTEDRFLATHDPLTGLANRLLLGEALTSTLAHAARHGNVVSVLFLDLDGFKPINDRYGHETGDDVLRKVAARLSSECRAEDTVARIGGDEFVVVAEVDEPDQVDRLVRRLCDAVSEPITVGAGEVQVTISIGVATAYGPEPVETLLGRADAAMYAAKRAR